MHRRWLFISAAVALVVVALTAVLLPDSEGDTERAAATPAASTRGSGPESPTASPSATATSAKPSASPTRTPTRTSAPATTPAAKPSATAVAPQQASGTAPLAGRIRPGVTYRGEATFYDADGGGACLDQPSGDVMTAAMNHTDYETAKACGAYIVVRATGGSSVTVRVTNECPECAPGHVDLSAEAFTKLADPVRGQIPITWKLLSPGTADPLSIRYKSGSSQYWCGVQVTGHRNPVARVELRTGSTWRRLPRTEYNYFLSEDGAGCGGAIRITDIYGQQLTVDGIALRPGVAQSAGVQFAAR